MARDTDGTWMDHLPMAMLGIRTAWRTELDCSPAELVYGTALVVPGLLIGEEKQVQDELPSSEFVADLYNRMEALKPVEMAHHTTPKVQIPSTIAEADFVYVRTDAVRQPLVRPYTGPFKVVGKSAKYFTIKKGGKTDTVSIDRLKPAFFYEDNVFDRKVSETNEEKITQPRDIQVEPPESSFVPRGTGEVTPKSYRDALCSDLPGTSGDVGRPKRRYEKRKKELRSDPATLRSGRISRPPVRL